MTSDEVGGLDADGRREAGGRRMTSDELGGLDVSALARLLDRQAIVDCIHRYARGVDRADDELLRSAYHPDAVEDHGGYIGELDGLMSFLAWAHRPFPGYQRYVSNIRVELDGDEAHAETYWLCVLRRDEPAKLMLNGGRYVDRLERRDGDWRIAERVVVIEWQGDMDGGPHPQFTVAPRQDREDVSYKRPLRVTRPHRGPTTT
jgi:SnoaL-like domain